MTSNPSLADELEAVNSIYNADTLAITTEHGSSTATVLTLPNLPFSFSITFPCEYPDVPPQINGTQSTGANTKRGEGEAALKVLREVLGQLYTPGQVCLFDLIEEVTPLLQPPSRSPSPLEEDPRAPQHPARANDHGPPQDHPEAPPHRSATPPPPASALSTLHVKDLASDPATLATTLPEPNWTLSNPLVVSKSTFVARALPVTSLQDATTALGHLLSTNKKVASATHNITAWRIRSGAAEGVPEITVQDCDDDGETAAGGRLLHLMQLMDVWGVVVVVTRWYGGVKLGPDRFRCVNMVAREALVKAGFVKGEGEGGGKGKGRKK